MKRLNTYNSITSQRPHLWIPQPWESGFHHMKFLGDTEFETIADTSMNWLHPAVAVFTHTALHPHFLHHLATIPYILSLWVSQVQVSQVSTPSHIQPIQCFTLPLLRPRGPTRKHQCVHFCKVPPLSLSGSSFLGLCWNRVDGNEMGKFWHHWLTWCSCSLLLVQTDWSEIPPDWQVFLLWGILVIIQDIHKLGIPNARVSFLIRGNVLVPTAHHLQSSPQPLCFPHSASTIWRKLSGPQSAAY